jgi:hypothetical protein
MADLKISELTNLTAADPVSDMLPIVDVSATPPASGSTKRISINNLLSSSPTASGALTVTGLVTAGSATITGDLTVDTSTLKVDSTNDRVGIGTASPAAAAKLSVLGTTVVSASDYSNSSTWASRFQAAANSQPSGILLSALASNGSAVPASLHVEPVTTSSRGALVATYVADSGLGYFAINRFSPSAGTTSQHYKIADDGVATWSNVGGVAGTAMTLNSTGLGVGVTPSAWSSPYKCVQLNGGSLSVYPSTDIYLSQNAYNSGGWKRVAAGYASQYIQTNSEHRFLIAGTDPNVNSAIAFTTAMTLDASGRLLLGRTSALSAETFSSLGFALVGGATHQAIIGEASGNVFGGSFTNTPFRIRTNNTEVAQFDASGNFLSYLTSTAPTLSTNGAMVFNLTSNTNLRISVRGTDGTTRTANITLA